MHFLGALLETKNEGIFLLLLLLTEVGDGQGFSRHVEALELLNIIADIVMSKEYTSVLLIEHEQSLREDVADAFQFIPGEDFNPLLKSLPLPEFLEELQFLQLVKLPPLRIPLGKPNKLDRS